METLTPRVTGAICKRVIDAENSSKDDFDFSAEKIRIIAECDPYLTSNEVLLLGYYKEIKTSWSAAIVSRIKREHKLNLRQKLDRCILAVMAARDKISKEMDCCSSDRQLASSPIVKSEKLELEWADRVAQLEKQLQEKNSQLEQTNNQLNNQVKFNIIVATDRLLPAGPPLNGVQDSPTMKILGSPLTITELEHNYRLLEDKLLDKVHNYRQQIKKLRLHPDLAPGESKSDNWNVVIEEYRAVKDEAIERLNLVKSLYKLFYNNWDLLKPTIPIAPEELAIRMKGKIPNGWSAESFWE